MKRLPGFIIGSLALCLAVSADTVFTRDGHIHRGKISLGTNNTVRVVAPGTTNVVTATNLLRAVFGATATKPGFSGVTFKLYQGNWKTLPDFSQMPVTQSGQLTTDRLDLTPLGPQSGAQRVFDLKPNQLLERLDSPQIKGRPITITATITPSAKDGVILAQGGYMDGYALYLQGGHLTFATLVNRKMSVAQDTKPLPLNRSAAVNAQLWRDGTLVLTVDGREAAKAASPGTMIRMPFEGLSVGHDHNLPMTPLKGENRFQGTLKDLRVSLSGAALVYAGTLHVKTPGPYQFSLVADAASRLEIDGQILVDNTDPEKPAQPWGTVDLAAGAHNFQLTYAQLLPAQPVPGKAVQPQVISNVDKPWIEDKLPAGVVFTQGPFEFVTAPAPVYSGACSLKLSAPKKVSAYFNSDRNVNKNIEPIILVEGDRFYAYAYLDPKDPPEALEMAWHDSRGWEHRAYWGQNLFDGKDGRHNTMRLWPMGPLPPPGKWARLEVPVLAVGYAPGSPWPSVHGWGFQVAGGTVYFDQCGTANPITVPPGDNKHLSLNWFGPGTIDHALTAVPHPAARTWRPDDKAIPSAGIMTWDGSFIPQKVKKADDEKVYYSNTDIARLNVSTIFLRPLSIVEANKLRNKPTGVLLLNGDFIEGELNSLDDKIITISSVLFGLKNYKPNEEAIAVVLKFAIKPVSRHHFKLRDGSRIFARKFEIKGAQIILSAPPFQGRAIPFSQISEMTYGHLPSLLQASTIHWETLSGLGRQLLETSDREKLSIVQQYEDWRARLTDAGEVMAEANKELPPLVKAETDALTAQAKALSLRDAARQKVTAKTQAHSQANTTLTTAQTKLDADCLKIDQASEALTKLISTRQDPTRQALATAQYKANSVAATQAINERDLAAAQTAIAHATAARQAAEAAAKAADTAITVAKTKLTTAKTVQTAAEKDLQAKQKTAADAHTALTKALSTQLARALDGSVTANNALAQARQDQANTNAKILRLNAEMKTANTNSQATVKASTAAATALTAANTKTTTATTGVTTAKTKLMTATNAVKTAKQTLESLQNTQLNPATAKAQAAETDVTLAIQGKPKADQLLADVNKVVAQAMKTVAKANKLAQTKFEPEQVKKDLVATQALLEQLKVLTKAAQAPIDDINATLRKPALAIGLAVTNSLATAMANKKTADQVLATLKENITKATTVHANAEKAAVAAGTKAKAALSMATTTTNTLVAALKDFELKQTAAAKAQVTMEGKFKALQQAAHTAGIARRVLIQANLNKSRAGPTALAEKARQAEATASSAAAAAAAKNAAATASVAKTQYTAVNSALTTAKSNANTKKSAADKARNALKTLTAKQAPANAKAAMANREHVRAQLAHTIAKQSLATAANKVDIAKAELQKIEQTVNDAKDKDDAAALRKQVTEAKQVLNRLTSVEQKQSASKVTVTLNVLTKAKTAKDAADKTLTALNVQMTTATSATRKATTELNTATAQLNAAQAKLDQAAVNQQLTNVRSATTQSGAADAKQALTEATAADKAAKALVTVTTATATKASTDRVTAGKALAAATQQTTASTVAHRAAVKAQDASDAKVKMARENVDKAAKNLATEKKLAQEQRTLADKAKEILGELSTKQQKKTQDTVTAANAAITKAQADVASAKQSLKAIESEMTALAPTLPLMNQAEMATMKMIKTLGSDELTEAKLTAEKKALATLIQKAVGSYVTVHQKRAMAKATTANTALTQAKANKTVADKASTMIKLKAADAVTVVQKAEQVLRNAEVGLKAAEMTLTKAQEEQAMAEKMAKEKTKQAADAKASLTQLTAEQKLAVSAGTTAKTSLTKATADQIKMSQAFNSSNKAVVAMILSLNKAKKAALEADEKALEARAVSKQLAGELAILELQAAAWKDRAARIVGDLSRLTALRQTPATQKASSLNSVATQALNSRATAEKALAAADLAVATQALARRKAIETGLVSDAAELKAQQAEADAWKELILDKLAVTQAEADYMKSVEEYNDKKKAANIVRSKLTKAKQETSLSNTNIARIKPAYDAIVRP